MYPGKQKERDPFNRGKGRNKRRRQKEKMQWSGVIPEMTR